MSSAMVRKGRWTVSDLFIFLMMVLAVIVTLYPFVYVLSMSISAPEAVVRQKVWLYPVGFSLESYMKVFENPTVWRSYYNTLYYTVVGTGLNILFTVLAAYPLSRRTFFARNWIMIMIVITMFFSGGMIPNFLLVNELGLYNTRWAILLPGLTSAFFIIITRTFLGTIPDSLSESARMDGANDIRILWSIILPLSKPILAVLALFYAVNHWNSYVPAMLYLPNMSLQPMAIYLMKVLVQNNSMLMDSMSDQLDRAMFGMQLKYSIIIVSILPILLVYPFLQRYFVKGVMIGSMKE